MTTLRLTRRAALTALAALAVGPPAAGAATAAVPAESLTLPSASGAVFADAAATGGRALLLWSNGTANGSACTVAARRIAVRARARTCARPPRAPPPPRPPPHERPRRRPRGARRRRHGHDVDDLRDRRRARRRRSHDRRRVHERRDGDGLRPQPARRRPLLRVDRRRAAGRRRPSP